MKLHIDWKCWIHAKTGSITTVTLESNRMNVLNWLFDDCAKQISHYVPYRVTANLFSPWPFTKTRGGPTSTLAAMTGTSISFHWENEGMLCQHWGILMMNCAFCTVDLLLLFFYFFFFPWMNGAYLGGWHLEHKEPNKFPQVLIVKALCIHNPVATLAPNEDSHKM